MCEAMKSCNGHGTCGDNGQCVCDEWYKFGDCSLHSVELYNGLSQTYNIDGPQWYSFTKKVGSDADKLMIKATD